MRSAERRASNAFGVRSEDHTHVNEEMFDGGGLARGARRGGDHLERASGAEMLWPTIADVFFPMRSEISMRRRRRSVRWCEEKL